MAECDHDLELAGKDEDILNLENERDELQGKVDELTDERDKYKSALEEISTLSGRAL